MTFRERIPGIQLALRASGAAAIAMLVAELLRFPNPIFAFISAVIVTDLSPRVSRGLGLRRIVSTVVGACTGALLAPLLDGGAIAVGLSILIAMLICQFAGASDGARVAGFTSGIIVMGQAPNAWPYAVDRFLETILGVLVALTISYVPKLLANETDSVNQRKGSHHEEP